MKTQPSSKSSSGFTLLEMGIVLLIIALVAASIVTGRNMLEQANKRAVLADIDKFIKATHQFVDKYNFLPGDLNVATTYWGADAGCTATPFNQIAKVATCNGNGDGMIGNYNGATYSNTYEWYRAWQHLANAGLIDGQFSGVGSNVAPSLLLGTSVPKSRYPNAAYTMLYTYTAVANADSWTREAGQVIELGRIDPDCAIGATLFNCISHSPVMPPADALEIDQKIDDGRPGTGTVTSRPNNSVILGSNCTNVNSAGVAATAVYRTEVSNIACALIISTGL
jgi:type II secretory pathway pseudopilin PulG